MINHVGLHAAFFDTQRDDVTQEFLRHQHVTLGDRLTQLFDIVQRRQLGRAINVNRLFAGSFHFIHYRRCGGDQLQIVFTLQTFLDDLHVQQAEEATTEAEAQRGGALWLIEQGGVIQAQLAQRIAEGLIVVGADREQACINLRLHFFEARQGLVRRLARQRQGITHRRTEDVFDCTDQPAYFATVQHVAIDTLRREDTQTIGVVGLAGAHDFNLVALAHGAVFNAHQGNYAQVVIEPGVDDQGLQWRIRIALRPRDIAHQAFEHFRHANTGFGGTTHRVGRVDAYDIFNFLRGAVRIGSRQVNFVQYRHHFQIHIQRGVTVSQSLSFYALPGIDHQQRALTGGQ
ncbi:hypothetical protein D3C80_720260 [compost metagenome]